MEVIVPMCVTRRPGMMPSHIKDATKACPGDVLPAAVVAAADAGLAASPDK